MLFRATCRRRRFDADASSPIEEARWSSQICRLRLTARRRLPPFFEQRYHLPSRHAAFPRLHVDASSFSPSRSFPAAPSRHDLISVVGEVLIQRDSAAAGADREVLDTRHTRRLPAPPSCLILRCSMLTLLRVRPEVIVACPSRRLQAIITTMPSSARRGRQPMPSFASPAPHFSSVFLARAQSAMRFPSRAFLSVEASACRLDMRCLPLFLFLLSSALLLQEKQRLPLRYSLLSSIIHFHALIAHDVLLMSMLDYFSLFLRDGHRFFGARRDRALR